MADNYQLEIDKASHWKEEIDALVTELDNEFTRTNETISELTDPNDPIIGTLKDLGQSVVEAGTAFQESATKISTSVGEALQSIIDKAAEFAKKFAEEAKKVNF